MALRINSQLGDGIIFFKIEKLILVRTFNVPKTMYVNSLCTLILLQPGSHKLLNIIPHQDHFHFELPSLVI
jgi:hypothetical protein